jgi:hypothetical protein
VFAIGHTGTRAADSNPRREQMVRVALPARGEAKPGKEDEAAALLKSALPLANAEPAATVRCALTPGSGLRS